MGYERRGFLSKTGGTLSGELAMGTNKITGLGAPGVDTDAATKKYVDDNSASAPLSLTVANADNYDGITVANAESTNIRAGVYLELTGTKSQGLKISNNGSKSGIILDQNAATNQAAMRVVQNAPVTTHGISITNNSTAAPLSNNQSGLYIAHNATNSGWRGLRIVGGASATGQLAELTNSGSGNCLKLTKANVAGNALLIVGSAQLTGDNGQVNITCTSTNGIGMYMENSDATNVQPTAYFRNDGLGTAFYARCNLATNTKEVIEVLQNGLGECLTLLTNNGSATGNVLDITNNGTGKDVDGHSSNWFVEKDGTATFTGLTEKIVNTGTSSPYAIVGDESVVLVDNSSGAMAITLPTASGIAGRRYTFKVLADNTGANTVTLTTNSTETIDGTDDPVLNSGQYEVLCIASDGTNWHVISN